MLKPKKKTKQMKDKLINRYFTTRNNIDALATYLGVSKIGSREKVLKRIKSMPYSKIKEAVSLI